jgi:hypothetical protein
MGLKNKTFSVAHGVKNTFAVALKCQPALMVKHFKSAE